jgi:hypothetical protein
MLGAVSSELDGPDINRRPPRQSPVVPGAPREALNWTAVRAARLLTSVSRRPTSSTQLIAPDRSGYQTLLTPH